MTIVSSERVVSVDGTAKLKQMWYYSKYAAVLDSNASLTFLSIWGAKLSKMECSSNCTSMERVSPNAQNKITLIVLFQPNRTSRSSLQLHFQCPSLGTSSQKNHLISSLEANPVLRPNYPWKTAWKSHHHSKSQVIWKRSKDRRLIKKYAKLGYEDFNLSEKSKKRFSQALIF